MIGQRIAWMGTPALFAGGGAGVVVAGRQLDEQKEDDRGFGFRDIAAGLGVGAAATIGTLMVASRIGAAGRPPAGRAASIVQGGITGSILGVGAGFGISAARGNAQASKLDGRIADANERMHDRLETAPDESTSWVVDGSRETSGWGTGATGAAGLTGAAIGMQVRRVVGGSAARTALGALGLLAGGIGAGAGARELLLRRTEATGVTGVSRTVAPLPPDVPVERVGRPSYERGDVVTTVPGWNGNRYVPTAVAFDEWASERSYASIDELDDAFHQLSISPDDTRSFMAFKDEHGYHLAYVTAEQPVPSEQRRTEQSRAEVPEPDTDIRIIHLEPMRESGHYFLTDDHKRDGWSATRWLYEFDRTRDEFSVESGRGLFVERYIFPADEIGIPRRGYASEAEAIAAMRATDGDQQVIEVDSAHDEDHRWTKNIELPDHDARYLVLPVEPHRDARAVPGLRARDEDVILSKDDDEFVFHHRDVAREIDGVEFTAHDGWFLTPGKVTDATFG